MIMNPLRDYQVEAADAAFHEWKRVASTLLKMPTASGKTRTAAEIIRRMQPKRTMFMVHRDELVSQAKKTIEAETGLLCGIEQGELYAMRNVPVVIATVQSLNAKRSGGKRMGAFNPKDFGLLVVDEVHHVASDTWKAVVNYMKLNPDLKVLGLSASPKRHDGKALSEIIDSVAYDLELIEAIELGWICDIDQKVVTIQDLDFSHIKTVAGDLCQAELAQVMEAERPLYGVAAATIESIGDKQTLVFASSVHHAEMLCEIFNRHKAGIAAWACGWTPDEDRQNVVARLRDGSIQIGVNCMLWGEGVDIPEVQCIVMGKPTKSFNTYLQELGRGLRPLPGIVDGPPTPEDRRKAISESNKPACFVLDFCGNSGRHKLISCADVLGGRVSEEAVKRAKHWAEKLGKQGRAVHMVEVLKDEEEKLKLEREQREAREEAQRVRLTAKVKFTARPVDPFNAFDINPVQEKGWETGRQLSSKERNLLMRMHVDPDTLSWAQGRKIYIEGLRRWRQKLATGPQCATLKRHYPDLDTKNLKLADASRMLDELAKNNWTVRNKPAAVAA